MFRSTKKIMRVVIGRRDFADDGFRASRPERMVITPLNGHALAGLQNDRVAGTLSFLFTIPQRRNTSPWRVCSGRPFHNSTTDCGVLVYASLTDLKVKVGIEPRRNLQSGPKRRALAGEGHGLGNCSR